MYYFKICYKEIYPCGLYNIFDLQMHSGMITLICKEEENTCGRGGSVIVGEFGQG